MPKRLAAVLEGSLGYFWPLATDGTPELSDDDARPGFVRRTRGEAELALLRTDDRRTLQGPTLPKGFVGATEDAGVVILDVVGVSRSMNIGGGRVSVDQYKARSVVIEPAIESVAGPRVTSVGAEFRGESMARWAGFSVLEVDVATDQENRAVGATLSFRPSSSTSVPLKARRELKLAPHWSFGRDSARSPEVHTGMRLTISSSGPVFPDELVDAVVSIQNLISIAFDTPCTVASGSAVMDGNQVSGPLWSSRLMEVPGTITPTDARWPIFSLEEIGGAGALARWIDLTKDHPRAVLPVANRLRFGPPSAEVQTLELAAAIEYWVAYNRKIGRKWARQNARNDNPARALARYVGNPFGAWVGDSDSWSRIFWANNNGLKHNPNFAYSPHELWLMAEAAQRLLTAGLLNRVAPSGRPGQAIFADPRYRRLGEEVRGLVTP